jgi:thiosulfate/3-mercaptopyruvate sulfurtransferase
MIGRPTCHLYILITEVEKAMGTLQAVLSRLSIFVLLVSAVYMTPAHALQVPGPVVDTAWLDKHLGEVVLLDVRADTESFHTKSRSKMGGIQACGAVGSGGESSVSGHIPDAVLVPWQRLRTKRVVGDVILEGMLPSASDFERLMERSGVNADSAVVITSKGETPMNDAMAARLYFTLKYFGFNNVALLDGGTAQWADEKRHLDYSRSRASKGSFKVGKPQESILATTDAVRDAVKGDGVQVLDVRAPEVYLGLTYHPLFVKPEARGHIPGAKNYPLGLFANTMGPAATLYPTAEIQKTAQLLNVSTEQPTIVYDETGGQASLAWFVFHELLGDKQTRLYDGSMNEWSSDPARALAAMKLE